MDHKILVGLYLMFYEDGKPRDTQFIEQAVYRIDGIKGTQRLLISPAYLPLTAEIKPRTGCLYGSHVAVVTRTKEDAVKVCDILAKLTKDIEKLTDFASNTILLHQVQLPTEAPDPEPEKVLVNTAEAGPQVRVRKRSRPA